MAKEKGKPAQGQKSASRVAPSGFFVLRTPLLAFDELLTWGEGCSAGATLADPGVAQADALAPALARDRDLLRERLRRIIARPEVREALFVASPSLDESLPFWLEKPESERGQKVERTLVRYFTRMAARPTPFGLFAGGSVGSVAAETRLELAGRQAYQRHTRPDMDYLATLSDALSREPALRQAFLHRTNSSLYRAAGRVRYVESRLEGKARSYHLAAVEPTEYLDAVLERAAAGARPAELAKLIVDRDPEITREEADEYVGELIDNQLLVCDLRLPVTGPEPIHGVLEQLHRVPEAEPMAVPLDKARAALAELDAGGVGADPQKYHAVAALLGDLPAKPELPRLFQVDMHKPSPAATLGGAVVDELVRAVELMHRITGRRRSRSLLRFQDAFNQRYEGREVPLFEVLDEESGIGFEASSAASAEASPLLEGLMFPAAAEEETVPWSGRENFLLNRLSEVVRSGAQELVLDDNDLKLLEAREPLPLPDAFSVMAELIARSPAALNQGDFRLFVHGIDGPSGAKLLGRFCHGDASLNALVKEHLRAEEALQADAIFAEIVHLPEGRVGNVLLRPVLRGYEIPYLGRSGAPEDKQIPVSDLMLSVSGGRIVLRSARLGREIIPRLTTAHNYSVRSLGIYRFLCALQSDGRAAGLGWGWGALEPSQFLPRVRSGRLILARARWRVGRDLIKPLGDADGAERFRAAAALRRELKLPRLIIVVDGDNTLAVDLENVLSVETFAHLVKERSQVRLEELCPGPDELCAYGPEGRFAHEILVPFVRTEAVAVQRAPAKAPVAAAARSFSPGSPWLYAKLYTGTSSADDVLRTLVAPLVRAVSASGAAASWFFIRYGDPDWHVRLRFCGNPERLMREVLPALHAGAAPLLADGRIWKIQLDTYERELDRYGGLRGVELAEKLFHADSMAVLQIVELLSGDEGADARWRLAVRGMDMLLSDLGLDLEAKHRVLKQVRESFGKEFRVETGFERQLGDKYRNERLKLEALLDPTQDADSSLLPGFELLQARSAAHAPVVAELLALDQQAGLTMPLSALAPSYLHMHANRLLRSAARAQELVIYDFLSRIYESRLVRMRKAGPVRPAERRQGMP